MKWPNYRKKKKQVLIILICIYMLLEIEMQFLLFANVSSNREINFISCFCSSEVEEPSWCNCVHSKCRK